MRQERAARTTIEDGELEREKFFAPELRVTHWKVSFRKYKTLVNASYFTSVY